ncbi:MAG: hypothetical protein ACI9NN_001665, partial [Bacteroidia bacterium]
MNRKTRKVEPTFAGMRVWICLILSLCTIQAVLAQHLSAWEYGINGNVNVSFIKPISSDTLTNKIGGGGGVFLERKFGRFSLQTSPTFSNVRYIQDFTNSIYVYNGIDWAVDVIVPIDAAKQTF